MIENKEMGKPVVFNILSILGSCDDERLVETSLTFYREVNKFKKYVFHYMMCYPNGTFSFPDDLSDHTLSVCKKYEFEAVPNQVKKINPDLLLMQGFGIKTCTLMRKFFESFGAPFIGPKTSSQFICSDKICTRLLLDGTGQTVPPGFHITSEDKDVMHELVTFGFPVVIKVPTLEDSEGVFFCSSDEMLDSVVEKAFELGDRLIIEKFIHGREFRSSVIEDSNGELILLGVMEYGNDPKSIRRFEERWVPKADGKLGLNHKMKRWFLDPVKDKATVELFRRVTFSAFRSMNFNDWAQFDVRMDNNGKLYILEVNLFNGFSEIGYVNKMARHVGISNEMLLDMMAQKALHRQ